MTPKELEAYLKPIDYFPAHTRLDTYEQIMGVLALTTQEATAVGYHRDYGWFVLAVGFDGSNPRLVWSQKGG